MLLLNRLNQWLYRATGFRVTRAAAVEIPIYSDLHQVATTFKKDERWGVWSDRTLQHYSKRAEPVKGDFAEFGVAQGATFYRLARLAHSQGKRAHAFDSFVGMGEPGIYDRRLRQHGAHLPGEFSVGGPEGFRTLIEGCGVPQNSYRLWPGWIPSCFDNVPTSQFFSLAILDVDHYQPTADALNWLWPRLNRGGFLLLDDCTLGWDLESSRAVKEFLAHTSEYWIDDYFNNQLIIKKGRKRGQTSTID